MVVARHHISDGMLAAYASGNLPHPFALVVAAHVSMCEDCRVALEAHQTVGGAVLETTELVNVSSELKNNILALLDDPVVATPVFRSSGVYPEPVMEVLKGQQPQWKKLGAGVKQSILSNDEQGSVRLLYIPAGQAVPDHSHGGLELTLVLQGSFSDETGHYGVGDVEVADENLDHTPIANAGPDCICLAATDAPLQFSQFLPRLLQPLFKI